MKFSRIAWIWILTFAVSSAVYADPWMPAVIGDHMVLQRGTDVPIWGWAEAGERVSVSVAGQYVETNTDKYGRWRVNLASMKAGGPHTMIISGDGAPIVFEDILIGEVWVCSGQSNMQWPLKQANDAENEIAAADHPTIRLFQVTRTVADKPRQDCEGTWNVCTSKTAPDFSAVGYFFGRHLSQELDVPIGLIQTAWGGTPAESWTSAPTLEAHEGLAPILTRWEGILDNYPAASARYAQRLEQFNVAARAARENGERPPRRPGAPQGPNHPHRPSSLFNGMIAPLIPYAIQGAIWYQGESNAGRAYQYRELFPTMIEDWREAWRQGPFPFYFVQLANFQERKDNPQESAWAELREAQSMTLALPNSGQAVIIDIGEAGNIHPRNKQDVGYRLGVLALDNDYRQDVTSSGPEYKNIRIDGDEATIHFRHMHGGLVARGGALTGFAIAGADRKFVWADARIDGDRVVVRADGVSEPVAVRYAWADNPACNLYNTADLPASPFRTDDWPGVTVNNH